MNICADARKNKKYNSQNRQKLVRLVFQENFSIKQAGQKLGFNKSTAKMVVRKYRKEGKVTKFKYQDSNEFKLEAGNRKESQVMIKEEVIIGFQNYRIENSYNFVQKSIESQAFFFMPFHYNSNFVPSYSTAGQQYRMMWENLLNANLQLQI